MTITKQYGVMLFTRFRSGEFAHIDDTCHPTLEAAMDEARHFYEAENDPRSDYFVLSVFEIDTSTGDITVRLRRNALINYFARLEDEEVAEAEDDRKYGTYEEQHRADYYANCL